MEDITRTNPTEHEAAAASSSDARFAPGAVLANRYRIVGRLGQGGMGDVFRADDLKLGTSVALKFLPEGLAVDPERLNRLHHEVRIARSIAHTNICRVYDIVEADGLHFITMEYVDGEDLAGLLRRIGRLSGDKTIDIMRQLCMGVAAAHEAGILHRDLKPANIMIDSRGRVRITDFGLAGLASQFVGRELRAGTPAYMAPEQFEQGEVSIQSDLYALGLVLYEMVTGRRTFSGRTIDDYQRLHRLESPANPSSLTNEVDPAVERIILQCLEKDATLRPKSAIAVAAALPGADPLAAALAAGETPSPELVAAAGSSSGIRPTVAAATLMWCLVSIVAFIICAAPFRLYQHVPLNEHAYVLQAKARQHVANLGLPGNPRATSSDFDHRSGYLQQLKEKKVADQAERWAALRDPRPAAVMYWYRQSPRPMVPTDRSQQVEFSDPPPIVPGMVSVRLDLAGHLLYLHSVPSRYRNPEPTSVPASQPAEPEPGPRGDDALAALFVAAGLERDVFEAAEPRWTPPSYCSERYAWLGHYPDRPETAVRIEAGLFDGRPVYFEVIDAWLAEQADAKTPAATRATIVEQNIVATIIQYILLGVAALGLLTALVLAWRNLRLGRGDQRGAGRLVAYLMAVQMLLWLLVGQHSLQAEELVAAADALSYALFFAIGMWVAYVAIEPFVRRRWPQTLISWSRLLSGKISDPLVARDVLVGAAFGLAWAWIFLLPHVEHARPQPPVNGQVEMQLQNLLGLRFWVGTLLATQLQPVFFSMLFLLTILVLRTVIQLVLQQFLSQAAGEYERLAVIAIVMLLSAMNIAINWEEEAWLSMAGSIFIYITMFWILLRFGILCLIVANFFLGLMLVYPLTPDVGAWYGGATLFLVAVMFSVLGYAYYKSLAGQPMFRADLLEH